MSSDPAVVRFRLSKTQMPLIWAGLDLIVKGFSSSSRKEFVLYSFPFGIHAAPPNYDKAKFNPDLMNQIIELWRRLRSRSKTGSRVGMNTIEIRAAIFAVRVNMDWLRSRRNATRKNTPRANEFLGTDPASLKRLKQQSQRTIRSLERHLKRANSRLMAELKRQDFDGFMALWRAHVIWMRFHLVYFRRAMIGRGPKKWHYQAIIDELEEIAKRALPAEGYKIPAPEQLRRAIRLFTRSSRRGRSGIYDIHRTLRGELNTEWHLAEFIARRLKPNPQREN